MKNVTLSISEDVARWARVYAAEHDTSVSALLSDLLRERMESENRYSHSQDAFFSKPVGPISGGAYPSRDSLYDR